MTKRQGRHYNQFFTPIAGGTSGSMDRSLILLICAWACWPSMWLHGQNLLQDDATLLDVTFVDRINGWAVGQHGTIWHTADGGTNWQLQKSGVEGGLHGVWFVDRNIGWAVGSSTVPYLWTSQAVVLRTTDGGQTWQKQLALLPALQGVKFFDTEHGVAWGRGSGGDPLGVFATDDGGRNWRPVTVGPQSVWWGGDFINQRTGIVVGPKGKTIRIATGDATPINQPGANRNIHAAQLAIDATGWLVGDHGYIARTNDGAITWNPLEVLPAEITSAVNWHTVAVQGQHTWIAGSPGTVVLHSPDAGETWQGHATDNYAPLHKIAFVDETHGWAVGDFGTILATTDGGQTWETQHRGGERAAVLVLLNDESQLPLATLAKLGRSDGYRTVVHIVSPQQSSSDPTAVARLNEALTILGCNAVTCSSQNSTSSDSLLADLVRQLRLWRPDVIVIPQENDPDPATALIAKTADQAIAQAASENDFPQFQALLALAPWQVSRVLTLVSGDERGTHRVQATDAVPFTGQTLAELSTVAQSLLKRDFQPPVETNEFLLKASLAGEPTASVSDLAAGLGIAHGSTNRRPLAISDTPFDPQIERRLAEKRRNLTSILRMSEGNPAMLAQVGQLIGDLDESAASALLFELAAHFQQTGQIDLTAACQELISRRYPNDSLADQALVWLVQFYASSETAHAYRQVSTEIVRALANEQATNTVQPATALADAEATQTAPDSLAQRRFARAAQVAEHIAQSRPLLYSEPQVRVPWAVAELKRGLPDSAERYLQSLAIRYPGDPWQECGVAERWLTDKSKPLPAKPLVNCRFTGAKPTLDGQLAEPFWQNQANTFQTMSPDAEVYLAYDETFLYIAVSCAKSPGHNYGTENRPRTYDADLTEHDRVQILLDLDRDYTTFYAITVDHRGWTNDACWQDTKWNPKWYVAAGGDSEQWTVEAAIPWTELTATPPTTSDTWAVSCSRVLPATPSPSVCPRDFGLLLFK